MHEITTEPHPIVASLSWVACACGDKMRNAASSGLVAEWVEDHLAGGGQHA